LTFGSSSGHTGALLSSPVFCGGLCAPEQCTCVPGTGAECQNDVNPFTFDTNLSNMLDFEANASTFSLPVLPTRGRSSSMTEYTLNADDGEYLSPKASSTTSLSPISSPTTSGGSLAMSRVFPSRNSTGATSRSNQQGQATASRTHNRKGDNSQGTSAFFEAAARRFGG